MGNVLTYMNSLAPISDSSPNDLKLLQESLLSEMSKALNNKYASCLWMMLLHLAVFLTFDPLMVPMLDAFIFIGLIATKLFVYSRFMDSQHR
jgi:hypothetical protein